MKLTSFFILIICVQVSAHGYSQKVDFIGKDVSLQIVFKSIEKQTGLSFFFNYDLVKMAKPVTLELHGVSLEEALSETLKGQELDYYRMGKTIFIVKRKNAENGGLLVEQPGNAVLDIKGRVVNQQEEPLPGASVVVKNGKKGTITDQKGYFQLKSVPPGTKLEISFAGFQTQVVDVSSSDEIIIKLIQSVSQLDETQVIAYGQTTQRLNTGNVTTVKGQDIAMQPVQNPLQALEGRVPGLFITQTNGLPGGGVTVRVQGQNSIFEGNDPLYIVDGVPYPAQMLSTVTGGLNAVLGKSGGPISQISGNGSPLDYINPGDIESISVLKDADATAIYGSRAANGAILITTKRGRVGHSKIEINAQQGAGKVTRKLDVLNTNQYLQMRYEAIKNDGLTLTSSSNYDLLIWDTTSNTDWQKVLIGGTAQYTNLNANVSGGDKNTQYLVGATYNRMGSVFPGDNSDGRGTIHFSLTNESDNQRFKMLLTGTYLADNNSLPGYDLTSFAVNIPPDAPALYNKDGSINWALTSSGNTTWTGSLNPIAQALATYQNKTQNLIASSLLSYEILPGLSIKSNFGYNRLMVNEVNGIPLTVYQPSIRPTQVRSAVYSNSVINSWIIEPQINYKRLLAKGDLDVLIGETIQQNANNGYALSGSGYSSDVLLSDIRSAATITPISSVASTYKYNALFGRINYRWKDRYILDFTGRRDGSSRFGPANEFHDFWALGGAWIFSEESFLKDHLDWLSFGKIRGSYGTTGNDQIGDYQFLNLYTAVSVGTPYQNTAGLATNAIPNPYLQWEETRKIQAGIELGFLKDRILITANYVRNRSSNELLSYGLPSIAGFGSVLRNFPATIENSDWDGIFRATIFKGKNFTWASSLNLTVPKNKLVDFPNLANSTYSNTLIVGQPINIIKVYHFMGVDPTTGVYTFADSHNNPTTSPTQQTTFVSTTPKFYGGFRNEFTYRQFHLDVLFQFVKQIGQNDFFGGGSSGILPPGYNRINQPTSVLARWQKQGDQAPVEKFNSNLSLLGSMLNIGASDAAYTDASFIRLKTLSLTYQFNDKLARKAKLKDCQIYLRGENLLTITKYKGMDPENQKVVFLPPLRMLTIGLQIGI